MANVQDVAAYILDRHGEMSTMKLQKLLYYCQGWSLAWDERPLFSANIEAWANGPVVPAVYQRHRGRFLVSDWSGNPNGLDSVERDTVDAVWHSYGHLSGQQLGQKTHTERPWLEARDGLAAGASSKERIKLDVMQDYFGGLAAQARE